MVVAMDEEFELVLTQGPRILKKLPLSAEDKVSIGRTQENDLVVKDAGVSRRHATVYFEAGQFMVADRDSTNGTFVNNARVTTAPLKDLDVIRVGKHELFFRRRTRTVEPAAPPADH
jgi:pSer/pThr/pTyr-binding forkhead associated (FHA) protein